MVLGCRRAHLEWGTRVS